MIKNSIDKSWKCPCRRDLLKWNKDSQGFVCPRCGEVFVKVSTIQRKPPGIIEKIKSYLKKK